MIHESERITVENGELVFKVNGLPWHLGIVVEYTEQRCNLIANVHIYNPMTHSVVPSARSWEENSFWCMRGHEPERLAQLVEHVIRTTIQESSITKGGEESGWTG